MNAMLNINVRIASAQARAELKALEARLTAINKTAGATGGGGMASFNNQLGRMGNLEKFGKNLQWTGRQLEYNFTLPLVLAGAAATKWALDNERASVSLRKVYGEIGEDQEKLKKETDALARSFELLSSRYGVAQSEVIGIGAAWAQAGAAGVAVAKATRLTLDAMIIGEMDAIEATNGVIAVQSAYRLNTDQLREALGQLNIVENQTSINFHGLIDVITRAGGTARTAGIDIRHLAAMAATLVPATGSAAQAGNALRTMISRLMAPTQDAADLLGQMGIDIYDTSWQAMNGVGRIERMAESFDKLTQAQKAVVSSAVASRWQINRFDILMEDIAKSLDESTKNQSAYNRALDATADKSKYMAVYAKELATVLSSSPKAFSILTRTIQNAMAKAILPLLPTIIGLLSEVAKLITWFADLDPTVQRLALGFLLLIAAVGPLTRYFGSFILLFTTTGKFFTWMIGLLPSLITLLFGESVAQEAAAVATETHNVAMMRQGGLITGLFRGLRGLLSIPFAAIGLLMDMMWQGFILSGKFAIQTIGVFGRAVLGLVPILIGGFATAGRMASAWLAGGLSAMARVGLAGAAAALGSLRTLLLGVLSGVGQALLAGFSGIFTAARAVFMGRILPMLLTFGRAALGALLGPWGLVAAAVVTLAIIFRKQIGTAVQWVIDAFGNLPESVVNVFNAVIRIVRAAALQVYEWLSYLNPFARHSPSLVESVQRGMRTILNEYSRLNGVGEIIRRAISSMEAFKRATGGAMADFQLGEMQQQKAEILKIAPGSGSEIDSMISSIMQLYGALDLVNAQISDQQRLVDDMGRNLDAAMKPYNDAIAENETAQKKLRLEILRMEQSGQSIDAIRDKMALLAGEIETMRATQTDLRMAGAGSDVLGFYDQQIAAMENQYKSMEGMKDPIKEVSDELAKLQREGEILNLEKDLKFDPQLAALEAQEKKLQDLKSAYTEINGVINDMEAALRAASSAGADKAAGDLSNAEKQFQAAAAGDFEVPGGTSPPGLGREGGLPEIEAFNEEMEKELQNALDGMGGLDMFAPIKDAWNSAWGWVKENVGPVLEPVWNAIVGFFAGIGFGTLLEDFQGFIDGLGEGAGALGSIIDSVKEYFLGYWEIIKSVAAFLWSVFGPVFKFIGQQIMKFGKIIGKELKNWAPMLDPVIEALGHIAKVVSWAFNTIIVPVIKVALGIILAAWKLVWPVLKHVLVPIIDAIIGVIRGGLEIIRGAISFILAVINGDWSAAWQGILTFVDGIWDTIYSVIKTPIGLIIGIVRGLIEGVIGFFQFLWDVLVGHSIIPDMMKAIVFWFRWITAPIRAVWDLIWKAIQWAWGYIKPIFEAVRNFLIITLLPAFITVKDKVVNAWDAIWRGISGAWGTIKGIFQAIIDFMRDKLGGAFTNVKDNFLNAFRSVRDTIGGILDSVKSKIKSGINFGIRAVNRITGGVNNIADLIPGLNINIGKIPELLAKGGTVDPNRSGPFITSGIRAIVGEGSRIHPEYVIPTDPRFRDRAASLFALLGKQLGIPGFASGGNLPGPADEIIGWGADKVAGAASAVKDFWSMISSVTKTITNIKIPLVKQIGRFVKDELVEWAKEQIKKIPGVGLAGDIIGGVGDVAGGAVDAGKKAWEVLPFGAMGGKIPSLGDGGIVMPRSGGILARLGEQGRAEAVVPLPADFDGGGNTYNFYGDLEFPNIKSGDDAEAFLHNLDTLVG